MVHGLQSCMHGSDEPERALQSGDLGLLGGGVDTPVRYAISPCKGIYYALYYTVHYISLYWVRLIIIIIIIIIIIVTV